MSYLKHKPGSIEEMMANQAKKLNDNAYQDMFKKELDKAGNGIGSMSPKETKDFFNKIDDKYKAKNEKVDNPYAVGMAAAMKAKDDKPPLKKSKITKAHDIAKSIKKDEKNEEISKKEIDKFHTSLDKLVHKTFGKSSDETKKEVKESVGQVQTRPDGKGNFNLIFRGKEIGYYHREGGKYVVYYDKDGDDYNQSDEVSTTSQAKKLAYDNMNEEAKYPHKMYSKDGKEVEAKTPEDHKKYADMGYTQKNETHTFMTKDMNKSKKDAKGEKEIVDPEPKIKQESLQDAIKSVWQLSAEELEKMKSEAKYMKAQRMNQYKAEKDDKNKTGTADTGSKKTKVDVEPSVDYKN